MNVFTLAADPVGHVINHKFITDGATWLWSAHMGNLIIAGVLTIGVLWWAAKHIGTGTTGEGADRYVTSNPFAHMIEVICTYLRDETVRPLLGDRTDKFMPYLWTLFFFILINNLLGLIPVIDALHLIVPDWKKSHAAPFGGTATQNIYVTACLAIISALVINAAGLKELGVGGYLKHLTAETPWYLWPLMIPIEIVGTVIKPVALAIRLFANMTAGHILMAVLFSFAGVGIAMVSGDKGGGALIGGSVTVVSTIAAIAIFFLELFVAFLQAFVFMFLTTVFISQLAHHGDHEHHEGHDHEHAHA